MNKTNISLHRKLFAHIKRDRLFLFLCYSPFLSGEDSSFTDNSIYSEFCDLASKDMNQFAHFKRDPRYTWVLEHVSYELGQQYLSIAIQQTPHYVNLLELFKKNDTIGDPNTFPYNNNGFFSPTTLRYVKVASDLQVLFDSLDDKDIIEIGGGYGGQCLILATLFKYKSYTIVDLPGPLALTKKYLELFGITDVALVTEQELPKDKQYDLVISNYAFSECYRKTQGEYLNKILLRSKLGYLTFSDISAGNQHLSKNELVKILDDHGINCQESSENPWTGYNNYTIFWNN